MRQTDPLVDLPVSHVQSRRGAKINLEKNHKKINTKWKQTRLAVKAHGLVGRPP